MMPYVAFNDPVFKGFLEVFFWWLVTSRSSSSSRSRQAFDFAAGARQVHSQRVRATGALEEMRIKRLMRPHYLRTN